MICIINSSKQQLYKVNEMTVTITASYLKTNDRLTGDEKRASLLVNLQ